MSGFLFIFSTWSINIITQLLAFFVFAIALNFFNLEALLIALVLLLLALMGIKNHKFYQLLKRLKWFYLVMLLIFALNTPGEHVANWPLSIGPTYEGVREGFAQLLRITLMLGALSLILANNNKQRLISGLYFLLLPLKILGLEVERFAARLWLTLHYVELQQKTPKNPNVINRLGEHLHAIFNETMHEEVTITLEKPDFTLHDIGLIILMLVLLTIFILKAIT
jgi:energy-coupling factor transporter transmembrane protein EcfT